MVISTNFSEEAYLMTAREKVWERRLHDRYLSVAGNIYEYLATVIWVRDKQLKLTKNDERKELLRHYIRVANSYSEMNNNPFPDKYLWDDIDFNVGLCDSYTNKDTIIYDEKWYYNQIRGDERINAHIT